jgi:hypothetical protein
MKLKLFIFSRSLNEGLSFINIVIELRFMVLFFHKTAITAARSAIILLETN